MTPDSILASGWEQLEGSWGHVSAFNRLEGGQLMEVTTRALAAHCVLYNGLRASVVLSCGATLLQNLLAKITYQVTRAINNLAGLQNTRISGVQTAQ